MSEDGWKVGAKRFWSWDSHGTDNVDPTDVR